MKLLCKYKICFPFKIQDKVDQVLLMQETLKTLWNKRKVELDQLHKLHNFLRDVNQLNRISSSQEVRTNFFFFSENFPETEESEKSKYERKMLNSLTKYKILLFHKYNYLDRNFLHM